MKIFLSYGHDDNAELVQKIRDDLENGINGGHDAWIDKFKIKAGDEWRRSITDGIIDSERVLAFMSKHSVREPGVCHDELAIALGHKGGNISTVLVEPLKDEELPLSVSHIQRLDMSDWKARKAEDPEAFEVWYREKFAEILRIIRENAGFSGEIEKLAEKLRPMDNNPIIGGLLGRGFVGRGWLFEEIEAWRKNERHNRVYCLAAGPGFGKSAISAWLAHTNKIQVIAAHFCRYDQPNWSEPGAVIRNIAFQMATRLPDYRRFLLHQIEHLEKNASTMDLGAELTRLGRTGQPISSETITQLAAQAQTPKTFDKLTPAELFDTLIAGPAQIGIDGGRERYLIVIDALDEAGKELIRYLADRQNDLPRWLALFATSRPNDDGVQQFLTRLNAHSVEPDNDSNRDDAREWIGTWLTERKMPEAQQAPIVEPLLAASEANFHYLTAYRQMVEHAGPAGDALLKAPEAYPKGLSGLYLQFFERQFGGDDQRLGNYRQHQRPLLRLVMASRRPLPVALARQAFKVSQPGAETEDFVSQVLLPLGSLFPKTGTGEEQTIRPFHKSLRDWLTNPDAAGQYYIDPVAGHETLGRLLWQEFVAKQDAPETLTEYAVTELPYHLLALSEEQELALGIDRFAWE
ncbi:toll/interleukin-1 receptor domain-containing protein, partial [Propionivibrio dicarboxylicus]